jgi:hypothetical protein
MDSNIVKYTKIINKFVKIKVTDDYEHIHSEQDKIYRKFIKDISNKKIKNKEIYDISVLIKDNVVKYYKSNVRWYA